MKVDVSSFFFMDFLCFLSLIKEYMAINIDDISSLMIIRSTFSGIFHIFNGYQTTFYQYSLVYALRYLNCAFRNTKVANRTAESNFSISE